jgi:survival-of-motor-neuron-related-splicing factor 30
MDPQELANYQHQLDQVDQALAKDPSNVELLRLKTDLSELIALTSQLVEKSAAPPKSAPSHKTTIESPTSADDESPTPYQEELSAAFLSHTYRVGENVQAKWSGDGKFYPAVITAIGGSNQAFSVNFKGYSESELMRMEDLRPIEARKRQSIFGDVGGPPEKKKKKKDKNAPKLPAEEVVKQKAWQSFAKSAEKKKKKIGQLPINKKSIFATPDNPEGKVGVVGSGRGMTQFQQRGKNIYDKSSTE